MKTRVDRSKWALILGVVMIFAGPFTVWGKDKIVIGTAISITGPYAQGARMTQIPNYKMWVEEVNAKGGDIS